MKCVKQVFVAAIFFGCAAAVAQSGTIELPSISAEAGHIYIANRTTSEVVFYLVTKSTVRTEHRILPGAAATYSGAPGDGWFNIEVYSRGKVSYGLDAGDRHYFEWNSSGILDVFKMTAR
jgi:hypothetical protein